MSRRVAQTDMSNIFDGVLPTPRIRAVSLKLSPLPPPINNPHIDHKRETIIYEGRDGTRKFRSQPIPGGKDPRNLLVEVTVVLLDNITDNGDSKWFKDQDLMKYLRLQVIHSEDENFTSALINKTVEPVPSEINKAKKMDGTVKNIITPLDVNIEDFYQIQGYEEDIREVVQKFTFAVNTTTPSHLSYFANVYLDTEQLINDFSLDLPPSMLGHAVSDTTVEAVYRNKRLVENASVFYVASPRSNVLYTGKPYAVAAGKYVASTLLNDQVIARELKSTIDKFESTNSSSRLNTTIRKVRKILANNETSKLVQLRKLLSATSAAQKNSGTKSGLLYKTLKAKLDKYDILVNESQQLFRRQIGNPTIRDDRTIQDLSNISLEVEDTEESVEDVVDIRSSDENQTAQSTAENLKNALYFSSLSTARDNNNNARMTFFIDWQKMIMKNTKYAGLLKNTNEDISETLRSKVKIQGIRLIRERYDDKYTLQNGGQSRDRESIVKVIADVYNTNGVLSGERIENNTLNKKNLIIGAMKEVTYDGITNKNIRCFEAVDYNISSKTAGKYRYRVEVNFIDEIGPYLAERARELSYAKEALKRYYNISMMKCNYDILSERFTEFFIAGLYKQYALPTPESMVNLSAEDANALLSNPSPMNAPWMKPIAKYVEILNIFGNISDSNGQVLAKKMYMKVEPSTGSPDTILEVIKQFEELETKLASLLGTTISELSTQSGANSKIASSLKSKGVIKYEFKTEVDCSSLSSVKARFLEYTQNTNKGLSYITKEDFLTRVAKEEPKYFKSTPTVKQAALSDMGTYRYSYLSPSYMQVGGKTLYLLDRGESLYEAEQYKEMMFSLSLLKTNPAARSMTMPVMNFKTSDLQQSTAASAKLANMNAQSISLLANFGIAFRQPMPAASVRRSETSTLLDVRDILGENTLLAINNAIDDINDDSEQVTTQTNSMVAQADATTVATNLITTLVNLGINNFGGVTHGSLQVADFNSQVKQEVEFSRTLDFYNLSSPENGIDSKVRSSNAKIMSDRTTKIRKIPNQIKSIFLTKTGEVTPTKDWFTMDTDPMASPELRSLFEILYFNLQQIEVLTGFSANKSKTGQLLRSPVYTLLTPNYLSQQGRVLCRMKRYRNDSLKIGQTEFMELPVVNEYFTLELTKSPSGRSVNPVVESNLYTSGGEYYLPDRTNYIGDYHIHKDGTVMTGAEMGSNESVLIPVEQTTVTKSRASVKTTTTLAESNTDYERKVLESMMSNHYEQVSVASEYCFTANTITSTGNSRSRRKSRSANRASRSAMGQSPRRGNNPSGGGSY